MEAQNKRLFQTLPKVARRWGVSIYTVREMVRKGQLKTVVLNRRHMVHRQELNRVERGETA